MDGGSALLENSLITKDLVEHGIVVREGIE